ncbi:hypothetical protein ACFXTN_023335 [Malus domestica]
MKSSFKIKPQRPLKNFHQFKIKPRRPLKKVFIIHQLFVQDQASTAPGSTTLHLHVSKIESEAKFVEEIVTPKSLIQILFCTRVLVSFIAGISVFTNLARLVRQSLPLISIFESATSTNGVKEGPSCSRCRCKKQKCHHGRGRHFRHHNSKQGKSFFCRLFRPCINSVESTRAPEARTGDHLASLRAPREESQRKYFESLLSDADSSSGIAMQVMVTGATSIEEQLAQMNEAIAKLTRTVEDKDLQIAALVNQLDAKPDEKVRQGDNPVKKENNEDEEPPVENIEEKLKPDQAMMLMGSLSIQQLQEMIANTIRAQYEGSSHDSVLYSKPYSKKIDALKMPMGYQPPKFMQFDGKGNPKQHVAHFIETCSNVGTEGDYLVKQFVRSLKSNAFDWYTDIEPESINS